MWEDGVKTTEECLKLKELREKYKISAEEHLKLEECGWRSLLQNPYLNHLLKFLL